jgi:hypothetical protein
MAPLEMKERTPSGVGYNKLNSFSDEDPAKRPLTFFLNALLLLAFQPIYMAATNPFLSRKVTNNLTSCVVGFRNELPLDSR